MRIYKVLPAVCASFLLLAGCASPTGKVKLSKITKESLAEPVTIDLFDAECLPDKPYRPLAQLTYDGVPGEYTDAVREFRLKAHEIGADALILQDPVLYTGTADHLMFRAIAIAYEAERENAFLGTRL